MRFLIADDSDFLRTRLIEIMSEIKGAVIAGQVGDAAAIMDAVESLNPDVVILDIRMQEENSFSALEHIKKRKDPPIVIMYTNYPYLQYRKKSMDLGADYFFYKTVELDKLIRLVKKLTQTRAKAL